MNQRKVEITMFDDLTILQRLTAFANKENNDIFDSPEEACGEALDLIYRMRRHLTRCKNRLVEVRGNGLIYWEPNSGRGHVQKALMLKRIDDDIKILENLLADRPTPATEQETNPPTDQDGGPAENKAGDSRLL